jgi:tRNA (guanosine-2'-O-)-methyltransferase
MKLRRAALALTALAPLAGCHPGFASRGSAMTAARTGDSPGVLSGGYPTPEPAAHPEPPASAPEAPRIRSLDPCVPSNVEVCFNALDDNCNGAIDEGCGVPGGVVQFMIAWDSARADVDLNVTDPSGELIEAGRISQSGLIKGRDCPGRRQECGGVNVENVFLEGSKAPTPGTYRLGISLEKLNGEEPPIWVTLSARLGAKHAAYEIRLNEAEDEQRLELSL